MKTKTTDNIRWSCHILPTVGIRQIPLFVADNLVTMRLVFNQHKNRGMLLINLYKYTFSKIYYTL